VNQPKPVMVEIAPGELFDKITVLQVKTERIQDPAKLAHILLELQVLEEAQGRSVPSSAELDELVRSLRQVNGELYDVVGAIYDREKRGDTWERFVELARSVYRINDRRALLKRKINLLLGSRLIEEKGHDIGE